MPPKIRQERFGTQPARAKADSRPVHIPRASCARKLWRFVRRRILHTPQRIGHPLETLSGTLGLSPGLCAGSVEMHVSQRRVAGIAPLQWPSFPFDFIACPVRPLSGGARVYKKARCRGLPTFHTCGPSKPPYGRRKQPIRRRASGGRPFNTTRGECI